MARGPFPSRVTFLNRTDDSVTFSIRRFADIIPRLLAEVARVCENSRA